MLLGNWEAKYPTVSHQPSKFGAWSCGNGYETYLIIQVTCNHVIILWVVAAHPKLPPCQDGYRYESRDTFFCYAISRDHMIKGTCDSVSGSPSSQVTIVPSFMLLDFLQVLI